MRWIKYLALFLFLSLDAGSQNETQKWFFGYNCGLDFATNPPTVIPSPAFNSMEGGASISDAAGNLLFYSDGATVWNRSHAIMANGSGLFGHQSSTQSSIIVKQPGSTSIYYLFTQEEKAYAKGFRYSVIDMSLAAGLGSVTTKNVLIHTPSCEKLAAVKHCNGVDVWVVTHDFGSNVFRSILVTAGGVSATPVLSSIGPIINFGKYSAYMKISPNGKNIAVAFIADINLDMFDFNAATGIVSNHFTLAKIPSYGCEFSPDSKKFYAGIDNLWQWDLCAGSPSAIINSSVTIFTVTNPKIAPATYQLAPNGKIYVSISWQNSLAVINDPNLSGPACNFNLTGQSAGTGTTTMSLPNFLVSYFRPPISFSFSQNCAVVSFTALTAGCSIAQTFTSTSWLFSDPNAGANNTSTLSLVSHTFSAPGSYNVKLLLHTDCGADTLSQVITVTASSQSSVSITGPSTVCAGSELSLTASGANSYVWNTGATTNTLGVFPTSSTIYSVSGLDLAGCLNTATFAVTTLPLPLLSFTGNTLICPGATATLSANGAVNYTWSTGATTPILLTTPLVNTTYTVQGNDSQGCINSNAVTVVIKPLPDVSLNTPTVCSGGFATIGPANPETGTTYTWQPGGANTASLNVSPIANSFYTLTALLNGCKSSSATLVSVLPVSLPAIDFFYKNPVCINDNNPLPILKTGFNSGGSFHASSQLAVNDTSGSIDLSTSEPGSFFITYSIPAKDCISSASKSTEIILRAAPSLTVSPDVKIGPGQTTQLEVKGGSTFLWSPATDISCIDCNNPLVSPKINTTYCVLSSELGCSSKACINIAVGCDGGDLSLPNAFSPNDDGYNDFFCLQGWDLCIQKFSVLIFNRWGEKVFESTDPSFCWDGSFRGSKLETEVFIYTITASFSNGSRVDRKGDITLLR